MNIKRKVATALATGALLLGSFVPLAFADTTLQISGNGTSSDNNINVTSNNTTNVTQTNEANIHNDVTADANTGNNQANNNTGGTVSIDTGNATSTIDVTNRANANVADVSNCGGCVGNTDVTISGNGSFSNNRVNLNSSNQTTVNQTNTSDIHNEIRTEAETGDNRANGNTGGDVSITTGNATTDVTINNQANANVARSGGATAEGTGTISALITGNGTSSRNNINLGMGNETEITQTNSANIHNDIHAEAETSDNQANDNTGGNVSIDTGDASSTVDISNLANFNWADADCCVADISAKISGNGSFSRNRINVRGLGNILDITQDNSDKGRGLDNHIKAEAETGDNSVNRNTDPGVGDDMTVRTGSASFDTSIRNSANANVFTRDTSVSLGNLGLDFSFNLADLLSFLHMV